MIPFWCGVLHRLADRHEQLQPGLHRQPFLIAVLGERHALHQFHDEERLAGWGDAAVVDAGDVRVVHQRQRLPLGVEPGQHAPRIHPRLDQLQRHLTLDRFGLLGQVDRAHAALADHLDQRVPAGDDRADPFARRDPGRAGRGGLRRRWRWWHRNRSGRSSPLPGRVGLPRSRPSGACGLPIPRPWWHWDRRESESPSPRRVGAPRSTSAVASVSTNSSGARGGRSSGLRLRAWPASNSSSRRRSSGFSGAGLVEKRGSFGRVGPVQGFGEEVEFVHGQAPAGWFVPPNAESADETRSRFRKYF